MIIAIMALWTVAATAARQDGIVNGKVVDAATGEPLEWVTVAVRNAAAEVTAGATTDSEGKFMVQTPEGSTLTVSMIGYKEVVLSEFKDKMVISLEQDQEQLEAARVTEKVKLLEVKMDKVVMNVSQSAFAQGSNGLDLIKKAPGVVIDKDGNITLNGKPVSVWIDGRPSYVDGKSLESLLRATDGGSIDKFEIMEHPSSKYDASGQGGIINIKTKKNALAGFNGSLGIDGGGMYFGKDIDRFLWQESAWTNLSYRTKKTNTFLNLYEGRYSNDGLVTIETYSEFPTGALEQTSSSYIEMTDFSWNVKLGNDWFIDDKNTLGVILSIPGENGLQSSRPEKNHTVQKIDGVEVARDNTTINEKRKGTNTSANLNYTHIFDEQRSAELTANLDYYRIGNNALSKLDILTRIPSQEEPQNLYRTIDTRNVVNIYSAKLDYQTLLWKRVMFEAGAKWSLSATGSNALRTETGSSQMQQLTEFTYNENIAAAYFNAATSFGKKWSLKVGLRAEYTNSFGDWKSAGEQTRRSYIDFFPTVFVGFNPTEKWRLAASYTRRINRPGYFYLNPTISYVDAHTWTIGNPDILPEISDNVFLSVGFGNHLGLTAGYTHLSNWIMQKPNVIANGDQFLEWGNLGTNNNAYLAFNVSALKIFKWLDWTLNLSGVYMNTFSKELDYNTKSFFASLYSCFSFILPKDWKMELDGNYTSPLTMGFYLMSPQWHVDFAVKKQLLDNRLTLSFNFNDIFRSNGADVKMTSVGNDMDAESWSDLKQRFYVQKIRLGISWNFGKAQQPMRHRNVGNLEEASRGASSRGVGK